MGGDNSGGVDVRDLWVALVDRLGSEMKAKNISSNEKALLGAALAKDFSDLRRYRQTGRMLSPSKHKELRREVLANVQRYGLSITDDEWATLDEALARHLESKNKAREARIPGERRDITPNEAWAVLLRRVREADLDVRQLLDPMAARQFVETATLQRMRDGRYDLAQSAAHALIIASNARHEVFAAINAEALSEIVGDAAFYLGLNAYHARAHRTLEYSVCRLAEENNGRASRSLRGNYLHLQNLMARRGFGLENPKRAYDEMVSLPKEPSLPPRQIIERAIRARHITQTFVEARHPLEEIAMDGLTPNELLQENIDTARAVGAMDSCVVAHVAMIEAKLHYRRGSEDPIRKGELLEGAQQTFSDLEALMIEPGASTPNTLSLTEKTRWLIEDRSNRE